MTGAGVLDGARDVVVVTADFEEAGGACLANGATGVVVAVDRDVDSVVVSLDVADFDVFDAFEVVVVDFPFVVVVASGVTAPHAAARMDSAMRDAKIHGEP